MILEGRTVLVVGVGPGLGTSCARLALRDGADVAVMARNSERLGAVAAELDPTGERIVACPGDVTSQEDCTAAADAAASRFGGLHAVINVAALDTQKGAFHNTTDEDWTLNLTANVLGAVHVVRAVEPHFVAAGGGSVVLIGSQASMRPVAEFPQSPYGAAKSALLSVARDLSAEMGPSGIRVNTVVPSWMWGPNVKLYCEWQAGVRGVTAGEVKHEIEQGMALREMPTDSDAAEAAMFLASERARMITGQTLVVNAGHFYPVA
jgi:NAD(P)-dependent dehydrogenase (short-subunit alcohol dehydrogenase family)